MHYIKTVQFFSRQCWRYIKKSGCLHARGGVLKKEKLSSELVTPHTFPDQRNYPTLHQSSYTSQPNITKFWKIGIQGQLLEEIEIL